MTKPKYATWDPEKAKERGGMRPASIPVHIQLHGRCAWEGCKSEGKIAPGDRWMTCPAHTTQRKEIHHALTALRARGCAPVEHQVPNAVFEGTGIDATLRGPRSDPYWSDQTVDGYALCDPGTCRWVPEWAAKIANFYGQLRKVTELDQAAKWVRLALQVTTQRPELRDGFESMLNLGPTPATFINFTTQFQKRDDHLFHMTTTLRREDLLG